MKHKKLISLCLTSGIMLATSQSFAQGSMQNFSTALDNSGKAIGHSVIGTVKLSAAVVGAPLYVTGKVGEALGGAGAGLIDFANTIDDESLPITDENITSAPAPDEALNENMI